MDERPIESKIPKEKARKPPVIEGNTPETVETAPKQPQEGQVIAPPAISLTPKIPQTSQTLEAPKLIRKKMKYGQFVKMVKAGKFISANLTAKILGVGRDTVGDWLRTPKVQRAIQDKISSLVDKMEEAGKGDWRAYDRLIQYALNEEKQGAGNTMQILIVSNDKEFRIGTQ